MATIKVKRDKATKQAVRRYCLDNAYWGVDGSEKTDEKQVRRQVRIVYIMSIGTPGGNIALKKHTQIFAGWLSGGHLPIARGIKRIEYLVEQWGGSTEDIGVNNIVGEWYVFIAKQWCKIFQEFGLID